MLYFFKINFEKRKIFKCFTRGFMIKKQFCQIMFSLFKKTLVNTSQTVFNLIDSRKIFFLSKNYKIFG